MIETARLILRPVHKPDVEALVYHLNNFQIVRHTARIPQPYTRDDAFQYLDFVSTLDERSLVCALALRAIPQDLIGIISFEFSAEKNNAELGYWLSQSQWGQGLMSEAANAVVHHAFTVSKTEKLVASFHNDNPVSGRLLKNLGFSEVRQRTSFSKAQGREVATTQLEYSREAWAFTKKPW